MNNELIRPVGEYGSALLPSDYANFERCYCSRAIVDAAGIRRLTCEEGKEVVGRRDNSDYSGLFFPYLWPGTRDVYAHRIRLDNPPRQIKGGVEVEKDKYLSAPGWGNALYFPPGTPAEALSDPKLPVVVLEGQKKALAAHRFAHEAHGEAHETPLFVAVGLNGVWGWRDRRQKTENAAGQRVSVSAPIGDLGRLEWRGRKVYILFDANVATNTSVAFARLELAREMASRGAEVWFIDLPEEQGINGFDDYLGRHGAGPALRLFETARLFDPKEQLAKLQHTDHGNELAFVALFGNGFLHNRTARQWLKWNGTIWEPDLVGSADRAMIEVATQRLDATAAIKDGAQPGSKEEIEAKRKRAVAGSLKLQNVQGRTAALASATSSPHFARLAEDFDQDDLLFACGNGVLDLRTQKFRAGRREDMITQQTSVFWDPEADYERWLKFLCEVFPGKPEMVTFIQRAVGYSLTGLIREEVFFILHGLGRNGKGVFLRVLSAVFGMFAANAEFSTLVADKERGKSPRNDVAALAGKRLVTAQESSEGARLDEALIKSLTGGDLITARFLHREFFTFRPTWKIWLATNHKPEIRGTDTGIWSRPKLIPFTVSFEGREDRGLKDALLQPRALSGVLRWAVEGCRDYLAHGLDYPQEVLAATAAYKSETDLAGQFIAECCERGEFFQAKARPLYQEFRKWSEGTDSLTETAFGRRLKEYGFTKEHQRVGNVYLGLRLISEKTAEDAPMGEGLVKGSEGFGEGLCQ